MDAARKTLTALAILAAAALGACSSEGETREPEGAGERSMTRGEHARDGGEHAGEHRGEHGGEHAHEHGGKVHVEEAGTELALTDRYDQIRNGARLILTYDAEINAFTGTVQNTTDATLERVRVEVHLSNGVELGPTPPNDLGPGETQPVRLTATSTDFDKWTAHPEVGSGEHGHGEEGR